jgi:hypothetical protein
MLSAKLISVGLMATLVLAAGGTPQTSAQTHTDMIIGLSNIGGLSLSASYVRALKHFDLVAPDTRTRYSRSGCLATYRAIGLTLWYRQGNPLRRASIASCEHFGQALVTSSGWHTVSGLAIGARTQDLLSHYPHAYNTRMTSLNILPRAIQWDLTITSHGPALFALVQDGHVVGLLVEIVGH